uniref:Uncharacterized protein n=1 Tax=Chromera velia CCMP2878 TaxID=1169474 RepID=A0A0G4I6M2_9ALVE|eukprot:Cvel_1912.t1-p1 / transcript=Cvel_1912.t1 / gene=Cvel_1912 / organism=Chromera_velia_CCMP2878 / gene_product=hypothetical protein / transcript_product=hypothetical protein / location=Cvel_scaffold71:130763-131032(+) / protein_length=90 / sequence_SO=supercontig / SO=protein_coding / is_pseudo=false
MTRGQVPKVEHRVVMSRAGLPRYSSIFELLPLTDRALPRLQIAEPEDAPESEVSGGAGRQREWSSQELTGREVFQMRSMGRSSVNWEMHH